MSITDAQRDEVNKMHEEVDAVMMKMAEAIDADDVPLATLISALTKMLAVSIVETGKGKESYIKGRSLVIRSLDLQLFKCGHTALPDLGPLELQRTLGIRLNGIN